MRSICRRRRNLTDCPVDRTILRIVDTDTFVGAADQANIYPLAFELFEPFSRIVSGGRTDHGRSTPFRLGEGAMVSPTHTIGTDAFDIV
jgi:hypothetical protein